MNKKRGYLALFGLLTILGLAAVAGCTSGESTNIRSYGYMPAGEVAYEGHVLGQRITIDQVEELVKNYLRDNSNLRAEEIIEFANDFYVRFSEKDTGINAFVALVHPYNGRLYPGHHPDKYWNTEYRDEAVDVTSNRVTSDMGSSPMTVTEEQAWNDAQRFIERHLPDGQAGAVERFYGYYIIPVLMFEDVIGLVSINGYTGEVCYEACHGSLIERVDLR